MENCLLPDGKTATVYVFNNIYDGVAWQNVQKRKFSPSYKQKAKENNEYFESHGMDVSNSDWNWYPTGPLTPYFQAAYFIIEKYGLDAAKELEITKSSPISYYNATDLGQLSSYLKKLDSGATACYEDSDGVYSISICRPKNIKVCQGNKEILKLHKNEFAYAVGFIPKELYKVPPVKLNPAKTQPFNPSSIPDSDRNLVPLAPTKGNETYYYDTNLANMLQYLAVKIACKGVYDMAYTGNFRARNPTDYYKTSFIKKDLAKNDGKASKGTVLFEGICFDYADFAYQELKDNQKDYPNVANFWMVGTFENSSDIVAYRLAGAGENSTMTINRTPVVVFSHNHILAHDGATNHAWFWVQSTDGTVYWIDPTWTDNTGRPVYGIVRGGKEIQLTPSSDLCVK
ncbi:MAG: hypothetical protein J5631_02170 [Spirochaetaceae bacterium]|nr:hypothetical protein [Spirochaetaceae bacterium]